MREEALEPATQSARRLAEQSVASKATLDSIAEAKRLEHDREQRNSENIQVTAQVMQDMLAAMSEQSAEAWAVT